MSLPLQQLLNHPHQQNHRQKPILQIPRNQQNLKSQIHLHRRQHHLPFPFWRLSLHRHQHQPKNHYFCHYQLTVWGTCPQAHCYQRHCPRHLLVCHFCPRLEIKKHQEKNGRIKKVLYSTTKSPGKLTWTKWKTWRVQWQWIVIKSNRIFRQDSLAFTFGQ